MQQAKRVEGNKLKKVSVLFIEADGIMVSCQGEKTKRLELKLL